jgi:hypothetical protein
VKDKPASTNMTPMGSVSQPCVRKPYTSPQIVHELLLETRTVGSAQQPVPIDPGVVDPPLPPKPGDTGVTGEGGGGIDPPLPPKPPSSSSGGGGGGSIDPPLPPKQP